MKISTTLRSSVLLVITAALMVGLAYASTVSGQQFPTTAQTAQMKKRAGTPGNEHRSIQQEH